MEIWLDENQIEAGRNQPCNAEVTHVAERVMAGAGGCLDIIQSSRPPVQ